MAEDKGIIDRAGESIAIKLATKLLSELGGPDIEVQMKTAIAAGDKNNDKDAEAHLEAAVADMGGPEAAAHLKAAIKAYDQGNYKDGDALGEAVVTDIGRKQGFPKAVTHTEAFVKDVNQGHDVDGMKEMVMAGGAITWDLADAGLKRAEKLFGQSSAAPQQPNPRHPCHTPTHPPQANPKGPSKA